MALETGSYIADLVATNPPGSDPKSQMDDHLRLLKTAMKNCFAGFTGSVCITGVDGGTANAYTVTPASALPAYSTKMLLVFSPIADSTGAVTLNISGLGLKNLKSIAGAALVAGDLVANCIYLAVYTGTEFRLTGITKNYADQLGFSAALPAQTLGLLQSTGTVASFGKSLGFGLNLAKAADVASAATPDIWSGDGNTFHVTGTTGITGFAAAPQAGATRTLYFDGACLLTNSANFNVQGAANYTTSAGDLVDVYADTTTKFYLFIRKADGFPIKGGMAFIASQVPTAAANIDLLTAFSSTYDNYFIACDGLTASGSDILRMRFANAGVVDTGTVYVSNTVTITGSALADNMQLGLSVIAGSGGASLTMHVTNVNDTSGRMKSLGGQGASQDGAATYSAVMFMGGYKKAAAASGFRLYWSGGALFGATGIVRVYGYNNS